MRVLVAGHLCLDFIPVIDSDPGHEPGALYLVGPMEVRLGGAVNTTGAALRTLGTEVAFAAATGNDTLASVQRDLLARKGIDHTRMVEVDSTTSYSIVLQPPGVDRTFWHHTGCNDLFDGAALDVEGFDLLHLGYPNLLPALLTDDGEPLRALCERAHGAGVVTSVDLAVVDAAQRERTAAWRAFLAHTGPGIDILTPSIDDLESAVGWGLPVDAHGLAEAARRLVEHGVAVAMVTGGTAGVHVALTPDAGRLAAHPRLAHLAAEAGTSHQVDAVPVERVAGTTGAGDTATAGFLDAVLGGAPLLEAGRRAVTLAARHVAGEPLVG